MKIYVDGACVPNPGRGGWGLVEIKDGEIIHVASGYKETATNNIMELIAIREGIRHAGVNHATIFSDSMYAIKTIEGEWKAKKNRELILEIREEYQKASIDLEWVKGHNGNEGNEAADFYANEILGV